VYSFISEASFFWVQDQDDTKFKMVTNAYKAKTNVAAVGSKQHVCRGKVKHGEINT